jgi:hypothetical protein
MTDLFGPVFMGDELETAVVEHLRLWSPTYLALVERRAGLDPHALPDVRSWVTTPQDPEKWAEDQLPSILVVSTGLAKAPTVDGSGSLRATWNVGLASVVSANTEANTRHLAHLYFHHALAAMLQHEGIGGVAEDTILATEWQYDTLPVETRRTLGSVYAVLEVTVPDVLTTSGGLSEPPDDPYGDPGNWPLTTAVEIAVERPRAPSQDQQEESS